jgi:hypothetical protein
MAIPRDLLVSIHEVPGFQALLRELWLQRPVVPLYDYKKDNIDDVRFNSVRQQTFDALMLIIDPFHLTNK